DAGHREVAGSLEGLQHAALGDLVEGDPLGPVGWNLERLDEMPGDRLAFAVRVRRQVDGLGAAGGRTELRYDLGLAFDGLISGREVALHVDPELPLGQVADVAHAGLHDVPRTQDLVDGL